MASTVTKLVMSSPKIKILNSNFVHLIVCLSNVWLFRRSCHPLPRHALLCHEFARGCCPQRFFQNGHYLSDLRLQWCVGFVTVFGDFFLTDAGQRVTKRISVWYGRYQVIVSQNYFKLFSIYVSILLVL